jgi:cold shock CspA family protein
MRGAVTAFDEPRGLGLIEADDGRTYPFHCTALIDGTRAVDPGSPVTFEIRPAGMGRWEATRIDKI